MKERWPEMLEYQQKVQAMNDLERAAELVLGWEYASHIPKIAAAIAAARQEGAAAATAFSRPTASWRLTQEYKRGAEEMRERAAQFHRDQGVIREQCGDDVTAQLHWNCAYVIGRLPLTPEEPA